MEECGTWNAIDMQLSSSDLDESGKLPSINETGYIPLQTCYDKPASEHTGQREGGTELCAESIEQQQTIVYVQDSAGPLENPPKTYLTRSMFIMICCCFPFGLTALLYSILAQSAVAQGRREEAQNASDKAKEWNKAGVAFGCLALGTFGFIVVIKLIILWI